MLVADVLILLLLFQDDVADFLVDDGQDTFISFDVQFVAELDVDYFLPSPVVVLEMDLDALDVQFPNDFI